MRDDRLYLLHIAECLDRIETYVAEGRDTFMGSTLIQDAVIRNLQLLGESARRLSQNTRDASPETDWRGIAGLRNVLVHDYLGVTIVRVWEVVEQELSPLRRQIKILIQSYGTEQ